MIVCEHVSCTYGNAPVVEDVYLTINRGEFVGIVGPSGSGKTTLLKAILGSIVPVEGHITKKPQLRMGYVPQVETVDWNFPVTVLEVVAMTRSSTGRLPRVTKDERADALLVLERLGLGGLENRHIRELSGGQQQRLCIARSLAVEPSVLLMDEPFGALDEMTREYMQGELLRICAETKTTVVFVTHSIPEAVYLSNRVVVMSPRPGRITEVINVNLGENRSEDTRAADNFFAGITAVREALRGTHADHANAGAIRGVEDR